MGSLNTRRANRGNGFCSGSKKSCGNKMNKCNCNNNNNDCDRFKEIAREKCDRATTLSNKAERVAQQARKAEERAEALRAEAIEECRRANCLWEDFEDLNNQSLELMEEAQECLEEAAKCLQDRFSDDFGCDINDFGADAVDDDDNNGNHGCHCNKGNHGCGCNCR